VLLTCLAGMTGTGLFAAARRAAGPLAGLISPSLAALAGNLHVLISDLLIALIVMHVLGVAVDWFLTGDNLVKAMLTGRKRLSPELAAREGKVAPAWRAILLGFISLALVAGLALSTDYTRTRIAPQQTTGQP
jgi:hypothetical protein